MAARHEGLTFGRLDMPDAPLVVHRAMAIPGSQDAATTGGLTWYANHWVRVQMNIVRERLRGVLPDPAPPPRVWDRLLSVQIAI